MHLDIKPDNILLSKQEKDQICLIDFGIAEKFQGENKILLPRRSQSYISGNLIFVSKFAFDFKSLGRRDDLICMMYMIVMFMES